MYRSTRPPNLIKSQDKAMLVIGLLLALGCIFTIAIPGQGQSINGFLVETISLPVAVLMLSLPCAMFLGVKIDQEIRFNDRVRERLFQEQLKNRGRILAKVTFRPTEEGTHWELKNSNRFVWTDAKIILEKCAEGEKQSERHYLGVVMAGDVMKITSKIQFEEQKSYRIMVVTQQGNIIEYPDQWMDEDDAVQKIKEYF